MVELLCLKAAEFKTGAEVGSNSCASATPALCKGADVHLIVRGETSGKGETAGESRPHEKPLQKQHWKPPKAVDVPIKHEKGIKERDYRPAD